MKNRNNVLLSSSNSETIEKDLNYWKKNAEEDYLYVPISVLRYIGELEKEILILTKMQELQELLKHKNK